MTNLSPAVVKALCHRLLHFVRRDMKLAPSNGDYVADNCIESLGGHIHGLNVKAGWWTDNATGQRKKRNVGELLMLCVSELAEVPRTGLYHHVEDDKLPHRLMAEVEIADCLIRLFDIVGGLCPDINNAWIYFLPGRYPPRASVVLDEHLMGVVRCIALAMEADRKTIMQTHDAMPITLSRFQIDIVHAIYGCFAIGVLFNFDLASAIIDKLAFNAVRLDHKVENRLKDGGKKY